MESAYQNDGGSDVEGEGEGEGEDDSLSYGAVQLGDPRQVLGSDLSYSRQTMQIKRL